MAGLLSTKRNKKEKNNLHNAYISGLNNDRKKEIGMDTFGNSKERNDAYAAYISRMETKKLNMKKEEDEKRKKSEDKEIKFHMYKKDEKIIEIWNEIEKDLGNRISQKIAEGIPKKLYIEIKSEDHNITAVVSRDRPNRDNYGNKKDILYISGPYQIPSGYDEQVVLKVLIGFYNESM